MHIIYERWEDKFPDQDFNQYFTGVQSRYSSEKSRYDALGPVKFISQQVNDLYDPSKGRPFNKLKACGAILVSDYSRYTATTYALDKAQVIGRKVAMVETAVLNYGQGAAVIDRYITQRVQPANLGARPQWNEYRKEIDSVILRAFASANEGVIDLLTEVVELNNTLATPAAIKTAAEKLALYGQVRRRVVRGDPNQLHPRTLERLQKVVRRIKRGRKALNPFRKGSYAADVVDAWMLYRFGIAPVLSTWEAVVKDLQRKERVYFSTAARSLIDHSDVRTVNGVTIRETVKGHVRCVVRSRVGKPIRSAVLTNSSISRTAWELVPQSWLVDRFINVGEYLTALDTPREVQQREATVSLRLDISRSASVPSYVNNDQAIPWTIRAHGGLAAVSGVYHPSNEGSTDINLGKHSAQFYERRCVGSLPVAPSTKFSVSDWNVKMFADAFALFTQKFRR